MILLRIFLLVLELHPSLLVLDNYYRRYSFVNIYLIFLQLAT